MPGEGVFEVLCCLTQQRLCHSSQFTGFCELSHSSDLCRKTRWSGQCLGQRELNIGTTQASTECGDGARSSPLPRQGPLTSRWRRAAGAVQKGWCALLARRFGPLLPSCAMASPGSWLPGVFCSASGFFDVGLGCCCLLGQGCQLPSRALRRLSLQASFSLRALAGG